MIANCFGFWRRRRQLFILFREIASVSGRPRSKGKGVDVVWMSARRAVRPEKDHASYVRLPLEWTKIPAIEACRVIREHEDLSRLENPASLPGWHSASNAIRGRCECREPATEKDADPKATDTIATDAGNRLQHVGRAGKISSAGGQRTDDRRQAEENKVTDTRGSLVKAIQSNGNARGRIPNEQRVLFADAWRNQYGKGDNDA